MYLYKIYLLKLGYVGLVHGSSQFFSTAPAASKNDACFRSGQY